MTDKVASFLKSVPHCETVLEIGACNVNGTARDYVSHDRWTGTDKYEGKQVDCVCDGSMIPFNRKSFDALVCCDTLEHCESWFDVLTEGWSKIKDGGICAVTVPSPGFQRHEYPKDFWRFSGDDLFRIFAGNATIALTTWGDKEPACGIIVIKTTENIQFVDVERI